MKEIHVRLPDWCDSRHIYILAGIELAAYQHVGKPMMVKTSRCSMCGECCNECKELRPDGDKLVCGLGLDRPFACCIGLASVSIEGCTQRFK